MEQDNHRRAAPRIGNATSRYNCSRLCFGIWSFKSPYTFWDIIGTKIFAFLPQFFLFILPSLPAASGGGGISYRAFTQELEYVFFIVCTMLQQLLIFAIYGQGRGGSIFSNVYLDKKHHVFKSRDSGTKRQSRGSFSKLVRKTMKRYHEGDSHQDIRKRMNWNMLEAERKVIIPSSIPCLLLL